MGGLAGAVLRPAAGGDGGESAARSPVDPVVPARESDSRVGNCGTSELIGSSSGSLWMRDGRGRGFSRGAAAGGGGACSEA